MTQKTICLSKHEPQNHRTQVKTDNRRENAARSVLICVLILNRLRRGGDVSFREIGAEQPPPRCSRSLASVLTVTRLGAHGHSPRFSRLLGSVLTVAHGRPVCLPSLACTPQWDATGAFPCQKQPRGKAKLKEQKKQKSNSFYYCSIYLFSSLLCCTRVMRASDAVYQALTKRARAAFPAVREQTLIYLTFISEELTPLFLYFKSPKTTRFRPLKTGISPTPLCTAKPHWDKPLHPYR